MLNRVFSVAWIPFIMNNLHISSFFVIQNLLPYHISNSPKLTVSWKKLTENYVFYVYLNSTDVQSTLSINQFSHTVQTFAVRETDVSRHKGGTSGAPLKPLRLDSALKALSSLRGLRGAPDVPPLCRETSVARTANVGTVGKNGLINSLSPCDA